MNGDVHFDSIRSDWYVTNTLLPRLVVKAVRDQTPIRLIGFPSLWIPACVHYGIGFDKPCRPHAYVPLFSDLPPEEIAAIATGAKNRGASRSLLESVAALDAVLADFIYIVDQKLALLGHDDPAAQRSNLLNTWHSFGRPEIVRLQNSMSRQIAGSDVFLMLPCSRRRPYDESRTHARITRQLREIGLPPPAAERVVVTALGVVPESFWREPLVMTYDAGAVDLWRVFQLLRVFFSLNRASSVIDCLSFRPYSQMLDLLRDMGVIAAVTRPLNVRWRSFYVDLV